LEEVESGVAQRRGGLSGNTLGIKIMHTSAKSAKAESVRIAQGRGFPNYPCMIGGISYFVSRQRRSAEGSQSLLSVTKSLFFSLRLVVSDLFHSVVVLNVARREE